MKIRRFFFTFLFFSFFVPLFSQPFMAPDMRKGHPEFYEPDKVFRVVGIRISEVFDNGMIAIDFRFNRPLNPASINGGTVLINGKPFEKEAVKFFKDGLGFTIFIPNPEEKIDITMHGVRSSMGESFPEQIVEGGAPGFRYSFRRREWVKF